MRYFHHSVICIALCLFTLFPSSAMSTEELKNPELRQARESVVFVFDDGKDLTKDSPIGTGFFVGLPTKANNALIAKFIITNAHVVKNRKKVQIRINHQDGKSCVSHTIDISSSAIFPSDKSIDLVALSIPDVPDTNPVIFDYSYILGDEDLKKAEIEEGTEVVSMGFLSPYAGFAKNFPVMRFGKLALITDENWWPSDVSKPQKGYVVEIYNVGGSSGSPVVLQPSQVRVNRENVFQKRRIAPYVIGVIKGHPNTVAEHAAVKAGSLQKVPDNYTLVSAGVAVIEPGESLKTLMKEVAEQLGKLGTPVDLRPAF